MQIVNIEEHTKEWHEWRSTGVNASSAPAAMGESKYFPKTPYQLYLIETGQKEVFVNQAMKTGSEKESEALAIFNEELGTNYKKILGQREIDGANYLASFDGYDEDQEIKVLEIKTTVEGSDIWERGDQIYKWQLVHQCMVARCKRAILGVYAHDSGNKKIFPFDLDADDFNALKDAWKKYVDCVHNFIPPDLSEKDYVEREDEEWRFVADQYLELQEKKKWIEGELAELKKVILSLSENMPTKGAGLTVFQVSRKGNVNYKKIPELKGVDLDSYRGKSSSYWVIK